MTSPSTESICPFCQQDNRCGIAAPSSCWCKAVQIPGAMIELLPERLRDQACICGACVKSYQSSPRLFKSTLKF
ncbi:MAG: hypothetical protein COB04_14180 [Gammaproteobacteria bacterium]|nr:MAG: hypothetical protein COB04_14180 [Gammaproteobacteria bacterium]